MSFENVKQVENSAWILLLTAVKGGLTMFWSLIHLVFLILFTVTQAIFLFVRRANEGLQMWQPVKPRVFGGGE